MPFSDANPSLMTRCRGLSLIEVVAALALTGGALTMVLGAASQLRRSDDLHTLRHQAMDDAEQLLGAWSRTGRWPALPAEGSLSDHRQWRLSELPQPAAEAVPCRIARLEILRSEDATDSLLSVDVILPPCAKEGSQ